MSKICNRKSKNRFDLEGLCQPRRPKTFEVETSRVFALPVADFAHIIDFCSYVDTTMSLYSIKNITYTYIAPNSHPLGIEIFL